jgi:hypothetical protein
VANATLWLVGLYRATHVAEPAGAVMATTLLACVHLGCTLTGQPETPSAVSN